MNLLIKTIYLFFILLVSKLYVTKYTNNTKYQNIIFISILYISNFIYRISVNYYFKKSYKFRDIIKEAFFRTLLVIVGIVLINFIISNPKYLQKYGIDIPKTNMYTSTALSLIPFVLSKGLLSPDI